MNLDLTKSLNHLIDDVWMLRLNRQIEQSLWGLITLKQELGIDIDKTSVDELLQLELNFRGNLISPEDLGSFILLNSSIARAHKKVDESNTLRNKAESYLQRKSVFKHFYLYFEKGAHAYTQGQYLEAIEYFIFAKNFCQNEIVTNAIAKTIFCQFNIIFALDLLDLPYQETLKDLDKLLKENPSHNYIPVQEQLSAFNLRKIWAKGEYSRFTEEEFCNLGQSGYLKVYFHELPYFSGNFLAEKNREEILKNMPQIHYGSYRMRNFTGSIYYDDLSIPHQVFHLDRLYLWTWKWLRDPENFPVKKVLAILEQIDFKKLISTISFEDFQKLKNSLLWMAFFGHQTINDVNRVLSLYSFGKEFYPAYELEKQFIEYLIALRDGDTLMQNEIFHSLTCHPLWENNCLEFRHLLSGIKDGEIESLNPILKKVGQNILNILAYHHNSPRFDLVVDLRTSKIRGKNMGDTDEQEIVSFPMANALKILSCHQVASFPMILKECYGISDYDPLIHDKKIFNLVFRMKGPCKDIINFRTKNGFLISEGNWKSVEFINSNKASQQIMAEDNWIKKLEEKHKITSKINPFEKKEERSSLKLNSIVWYKRVDLEKAIGTSRSTATRQIKMWLDSEQIEKRGNAKNTEYKLSEKVISEISQSTTSYQGALQ